MPDPYEVLGASAKDTDEVIRARYLEAVRKYPPSRCPREFQRVRDAYERIKDEESRLVLLLFDPTQGKNMDELLAEEECRKISKRPSLSELLSLLDET